MSETGEKKFYYGYIIVMAGFGIQLMAIGTLYSFGIFFPPLMEEFHWSRVTISGAASLSSFVFGALAMLTGGLSDRFGPRIVMTACGIFLGAGFLLLSQVTTVWQLYLFYGLVIGVGMSATDVVPLSAIARWFTTNIGIMTGVAKVGAGVGILILPLLVSGLIAGYGWRFAYVVIGLIVLAIVVSAAQFLKSEPDQKQQLPFGAPATERHDFSQMTEGLSLREAVNRIQLWTVCILFLSLVLCVQTIMVHIAPHAVDLGMSLTGSASLISIIGILSIGGRLVIGGLSDRIGSKRAMTICFVLLILALVGLQLSHEIWMLYVFAALYGVSHGGFFTLRSPVVAWLFGRRSHGAIFGITVFSGTIGAAIGPVMGGYIFDITGSYQLAFWILLVIAIAGVILNSTLRPATTESSVT
ncbi:MFS transporter [Chloroflexota bacterium]